jgi:phosphohistidine phosphatase
VRIDGDTLSFLSIQRKGKNRNCAHAARFSIDSVQIRSSLGFFEGKYVKIILMRHGDADADIPEGLDDRARALTSRARLFLPQHAAELKTHVGTPDLIFMSPLVRTVQTATILAAALAYDGPLKSHRALLPDGPVGAVDSLLSTLPADHVVVLVGHQPTIGAAAAHFLGMNGFPRQVTPGTAIGIERSPGFPAGKLLFFASPGLPVSFS